MGVLPAQGLGSDLPHIDVGPQGGDGAALGVCPLDHGDGLKVSCDFSPTSLLIKDLSVKRLHGAAIY